MGGGIVPPEDDCCENPDVESEVIQKNRYGVVVARFERYYCENCGDTINLVRL